MGLRSARCPQTHPKTSLISIRAPISRESAFCDRVPPSPSLTMQSCLKTMQDTTNRALTMHRIRFYYVLDYQRSRSFGLVTPLEGEVITGIKFQNALLARRTMGKRCILSPSFRTIAVDMVIGFAVVFSLTSSIPAGCLPITISEWFASAAALALRAPITIYILVEGRHMAVLELCIILLKMKGKGPVHGFSLQCYID